MFARDVLGHYTLTPSTGPQTEEDILAAAEDILARRLYREATISNPRDMEQFLRMRLGHLAHEVFDAVWLDNRHRVIGVERLATGTVDGASVHPREVVKAALRANASAVVFSHNHPSGLTTESQADKQITKELQAALALVGTRVLDHLIVSAGQECTSFAARGLL
ncbi:DNA repair protein RadC [Frateuria sp. Soil773]|uniref:JAB domain-containing protein n=1 Tax=Frateuria sp. Soil773 TaxID=1736407 RepID=UPI0006FAD4BC|nr:JAB domain-containing protein [Frateuria sp. Soil773]KRE90860.1 DNA repair protein RadC [Frateuria sp. Soil773]